MRFDTIFRVGVIGESKTVNLLLGGALGEDPVLIATFMKRQIKFKKKKIKVEFWIFNTETKKHLHLVDMFCYEKRLDILVFCFDPGSLQSLHKCEKLNQMVLSSTSGAKTQKQGIDHFIFNFRTRSSQIFGQCSKNIIRN